MRRTLVLLFALVPGNAFAEEPIRHVVKAHETCAAIALRYYGDSRLVDPIHRANPDLGRRPPPHELREGTVLLIPAKEGLVSAPDAQLTTVRNQVEVQNPEAKPGKPNDPLFRGNRVSTQEASAADVTFRDETQVKLGERTLVIILGDARSSAAKTSLAGGAQTTLVTGNLRAFMSGARKDVPAAVATDAAAVKVWSGEAQVSADAVKTTRLAVYAGSSTIDARGKTREVARGYGSKAELGKQPTPPRPLPPPPAWTVAPPLIELDRGAPSIVGEYDLSSPDVHVAQWRVQLARDGIFRDVVADVTVPAAVRRLEAQAPGPGRYYVRVSAIDDDHFEGPFSRVAVAVVIRVETTNLPGSRRSLRVLPSDAYCLRVGNVPLVKVDGPLVVGAGEPVRLRCAPNDTSPTTLLSLDGPIFPAP